VLKAELCKIETMNIEGDTLEVTFKLKLNNEFSVENFNTLYRLRKALSSIAELQPVNVGGVVYGPENPPPY
jgi:hypothetical protein